MQSGSKNWGCNGLIPVDPDPSRWRVGRRIATEPRDGNDTWSASGPAVQSDSAAFGTSRNLCGHLLVLAVDDNPGVRSIKAGVYAGDTRRLVEDALTKAGSRGGYAQQDEKADGGD